MLTALLLALLLATASGLWLYPAWRRDANPPDRRVAAHALAAATVLLLLLLGLDHQSAADKGRLSLVFLALATGMLLFLKRQRLQQRPLPLLLLHAAMALAALGYVAWQLR